MTTRSARADSPASARPGWPCTTSWLTGTSRVLGPALVEQAGKRRGRVRRGPRHGTRWAPARPGVSSACGACQAWMAVQARVPQAGLLEREGERVAAAFGVGHADADEPVRGRRLVPDNHDRGGRVAGGRNRLTEPSSRGRGERAGAAGSRSTSISAPDPLSVTACARRPGSAGRVVDQHAGRCLGGPVRPLRPAPGHGRRRERRSPSRTGSRLCAASSGGKQPGGGHDPQRGTAQGGFPSRPSRPLAVIPQNRPVPATMGLRCHGSSSLGRVVLGRVVLRARRSRTAIMTARPRVRLVPAR